MLLDNDIDLLIHLGDIGTVDVIDALAVVAPGSDRQIEARMVFGNTDWDRDALREYATDLDIAVDDEGGTLDLRGGELAFCHGDSGQVMARALAREVRYLCHGHTHRRLDERVNQTRVINPGALFRAPRVHRGRARHRMRRAAVPCRGRALKRRAVSAMMRQQREQRRVARRTYRLGHNDHG